VLVFVIWLYWTSLCKKHKETTHVNYYLPYSILQIILKVFVYLQFQLAVNMRNVFSWAIMQRVVVIPNWRFGTNILSQNVVIAQKSSVLIYFEAKAWTLEQETSLRKSDCQVSKNFVPTRSRFYFHHTLHIKAALETREVSLARGLPWSKIWIISNFMSSRSGDVPCGQTSRRTDGFDESIAAFRNYTNAPKT
jgi:hypothetical protein